MKNSPSLKFVHWWRGQKGQNKMGGGIFPCVQYLNKNLDELEFLYMWMFFKKNYELHVHCILMWLDFELDADDILGLFLL